MNVQMAQDQEKQPAEHLIKASNSYFIGLGLQVLGVAILLNTDEYLRPPGYVMLGVGTVFQLSAWGQIGKAGRKMKKAEALKKSLQL